MLNIPSCGSHGGLKMDKRNYSKKEMERIIRRYCVELVKYGYIGPGVDVPSTEEGSRAWHMDLLKDTYQTLYGLNDINQ